MAKQKLNVEVVVGLVNRLSKPLQALSRDLRRAGAQLSMAGMGAAASGRAIADPLIDAVKASAELSKNLTEVGIVADVSAARLAQIRPELHRIAAASNQTVNALSEGLKDLTAKGLGFDAALTALPAIAKSATAAGAEMADMSAAASALIDTLKIAPGELQKSLDILTVAGNEGAFELKDMAREFPSLTAALSQIGMTGESAVSTLGAALQVVRKGAGTSAEAANNLLNLLVKLTAPTTVKAMEKQWGYDLPAAFKRWQQQGLNPVEESLRLIQERTGGDAFKIGEIFGDMQVMSALKPMLANMAEYQRIKAASEQSSGAADAQFARRMKEDPTEQFKRLTIQFAKLTDTLGMALLPVLSSIGDRLMPIIERLGAWIDAHKDLATTLTLIVAGFGALMVLLGPLLMGLGGLSAAFAFLPAAAAGFVSLIGLVGKLSAVLMLTPVGVVTTLLVGAAVLIYRHWDQLKGWFAKFWDWMTTAVQSWRAKFTETINNIRATVGEWVDWLMTIPDQLADIGGQIVDGLWQGFESKWGQFQTWMSGLAGSIPETFESVLGINSPSRVFAGIGGHIVDGLQQGMGVTAMPVPSLARAGGPVNMPITINITAPAGSDARDIARLVRSELSGATRQAGRGIGALWDGSDGF